MSALVTKTRTFLTYTWRGFKWVITAVILSYVVFLLAYRSAPITYSAFMYQQDQLAKGVPKTYAKAKQVWVNYQHIPETLKVAVLAAEDQRFPEHFGVDFTELKSALRANAAGKKMRGASTITQQTVKNLFFSTERSYLRKIVEIPMAMTMELLWRKSRILEVYLNIAQFGPGIYGVQAASKHYYGKDVRALTLKQQHILASVLPSPSTSNVHQPGERLRKKVRWVEKQVKQLDGAYFLRDL